MSVFINPFTDFGFKHIFGQEEHKGILIGFLNALFKDEFVVTDLTYRDKELLGMSSQDRGIIFDLYCTLADQSHVIIEMQNKKQVNFDARALYYAASAIVAQGQKGGNWQYDYHPVIGVYWMNFNEPALETAFRKDFALTVISEIDYVKQEQALNPKSHGDSGNSQQTSDSPKISQSPADIFTKRLRMVFLQLPRFQKKAAECQTDLEKWVYIMKNMEKLDNIPWSAQDEVYAELAKVSNVAALSRDERFIYEQNLRVYRDLLATKAAEYNDGFNDGKIVGVNEGISIVARAMKQCGTDPQFIAKMTGLSLESIHAL